MTSAELRNEETLYDDYAADEAEVSGVEDYDVSTSPNDFNISTMHNFIKSGVLVIPGFQRNYVWDIKRASKLIESLIIGLPVPQIFLHEAARNRFHVIDGQQRLMSIYYFIEQRFPRHDARAKLRRVFAEHGRIPDDVLQNGELFTDFRLNLPEKTPGSTNRLHGLSYDDLGDYELQFSLRTIRNVVIRQNPPQNDAAIYEIFNRLNSGGVNITPQEMRMSLYFSDFYSMLLRANYEPEWRRLLNSAEPDLHLKDMELLLRMFAMLIGADKYSPSMSKFLNQFSKECQSNTREVNRYLEDVFKHFLKATSGLPGDVFVNKSNNHISIALMEAVFAATCRVKYQAGGLPKGNLNLEELRALGADQSFVEASQRATTQRANVHKRLDRAFELVSPL